MKFDRFGRILATMLVFTFLLNSCTKETSSDDPLSPQEEQEAAMAMSESEAEAELVFNDVFDNVMGANDDVGMAGTGVFGRVAATGYGPIARTDSTPCFTVTVTHLNNSTPFPVRIVLDFGAGCVGRDGHLRSGKIITTYTSRLVVPGASSTTTFENFYIDSIRVQGIYKITNTSTSSVHQFKIDVENAKLTKTNGNYSEWNSHKTITQAEGTGTPFFPLDDIYKIEGSANGKVKRGDRIFAWRSEIAEPLIKKFTCRWIVKGIVRTGRLSNTVNSPWVAVLNYGNGSCDNQATLTINGTTHQITLN
jgi:hypothetical protein